MNIYTKNGDGGMTSLIHASNIPKSDCRIELVGTLDELNSHIGLIKSEIGRQDIIERLTNIQNHLMTVMAGIADPHNMKYRLKPEETEELEGEIDRLVSLYDQKKGFAFVLPGGNPLSAKIDVARTVARRGERKLSTVSIKYGSDANAKKYLNRLADYLYALARYMDKVFADRKEDGQLQNAAKESTRMADEDHGGRSVPETMRRAEAVQQEAAPEKPEGSSGGRFKEMAGNLMENINDAVVQEVLKRVAGPMRINLFSAKKLIERIEDESRRRGLKSVIAVCGPDGNPIAVHVMDDAFLVSFDVAMKKAYTSVAVKMSTKELSVLAQPGGTFYGVDKMDNGKIVIFGGGVPLKVDGRIIGGLGISGGTGEEDHSLAEYGASILRDVL